MTSLPGPYRDLLTGVVDELTRRAARDGTNGTAPHPSKSILGTLGSRSKKVMKQVRVALSRDPELSNLHSLLSVHGPGFGIVFDSASDTIAMGAPLPPSVINKFLVPRPVPGTPAFAALLHSAVSILKAELAGRASPVMPATELGARQEIADIRAAYVAAGEEDSYKLNNILRESPFKEVFVVSRVGSGPGHEIRLRSNSTDSGSALAEGPGSGPGSTAASPGAISPADPVLLSPRDGIVLATSSGTMSSGTSSSGLSGLEWGIAPGSSPSIKGLNMGSGGGSSSGSIRRRSSSDNPVKAHHITTLLTEPSVENVPSQSKLHPVFPAPSASVTLITPATLMSFYSHLDQLPLRATLAMTLLSDVSPPAAAICLPVPAPHTYIFARGVWVDGGGAVATLWDHLRVLLTDDEFTLVVHDAAAVAATLNDPAQFAPPLDILSCRANHDPRILDVAVVAARTGAAPESPSLPALLRSLDIRQPDPSPHAWVQDAELLHRALSSLIGSAPKQVVAILAELSLEAASGRSIFPRPFSIASADVVAPMLSPIASESADTAAPATPPATPPATAPATATAAAAAKSAGSQPSSPAASPSTLLPPPPDAAIDTSHQDQVLALIPTPLRDQVLEAHTSLAPDWASNGDYLHSIVLDIGSVPMLRYNGPGSPLKCVLATNADPVDKDTVDAIIAAPVPPKSVHTVRPLGSNPIQGCTLTVGRPWGPDTLPSARLVADVIEETISSLIIGPIASGKTTLARAIAAGWAASSPGSVLLIDPANSLSGDSQGLPDILAGSRAITGAAAVDLLSRPLDLVDAVLAHAVSHVVLDNITPLYRDIGASLASLTSSGIVVVCVLHVATIQNIPAYFVDDLTPCMFHRALQCHPHMQAITVNHCWNDGTRFLSYTRWAQPSGHNAPKHDDAHADFMLAPGDQPYASYV